MSVALFDAMNEWNRVPFLEREFSCLHNEQSNTWLLGDTEFLFSCSTRYLTSVRSERVRYRFERSWGNSISPCAFALFSIYITMIGNIHVLFCCVMYCRLQPYVHSGKSTKQWESRRNSWRRRLGICSERNRSSQRFCHRIWLWSLKRYNAGFNNLKIVTHLTTLNRSLVVRYVDLDKSPFNALVRSNPSRSSISLIWKRI